MKFFQSLLILVIASVGFSLEAAPIVIGGKPTGLIVETLAPVKPDKAGIVLSRQVELPAFERGAYPNNKGWAVSGRTDK